IIAGVNSGPGDEPSLKRGVIWSGGRYVGPDQPFVLELNPDQQSAKMAVAIAERISETLQGPSLGLGGTPVAEAKSNTHVFLTVPGAYRLNKARFLRVVRLVPLNEVPGPESAYAQKLQHQLLDPSTTITAALRLEALGAQSIPALKVGLQS